MSLYEEISVLNRVAIGDIIRRTARRVPDKTAIIDGDFRITYRQFDQLTNQFANYLKSLGLEKGDAVATIAINSTAHLIAIFGTQKAGLIWVPINPGLTIDEQLYILEEVDAQLIVADLPIVKPHLERLSDYPILYTANFGQNEIPTVLDTIQNQPPTELEVDIKDRDVAQIMFTSGTTGKPKGVMISHLSVYMASLSNIIETRYFDDNVATILMPMFHCAQHTFIVSLFNIGSTGVIFQKFDPIHFMETVEKEKISFVFLLPMMYRAFIHHPEREKYDLSSIKTCVYAMAPMDRPTLEKGIELGFDFMLGSGQTEIYPGTVFFKPEDQLRKVGSYWGNTAIVNDTAIMDDDGNLLPQGEVGEIVHRGPNVMIGYLNNEEETREARKYDWHHTGDLGYIDEDGLLVFVDRKKDIIKTGGENVASVRIESILLAHEKIANVGVVGLPHERWSEAVTAFVQLKPGFEAEEEEILEYCKANMNKFEVPKKIVILEALPLTTTGKVKKHVLREQFKNLYDETTTSSN